MLSYFKTLFTLRVTQSGAAHNMATYNNNNNNSSSSSSNSSSSSSSNNNNTKITSTSSSHCLSTSQECFPDFTHLQILEQSKYANIHIQLVSSNKVSQTCNFLPLQTVHLIHAIVITRLQIFFTNNFPSERKQPT